MEEKKDWDKALEVLQEVLNGFEGRIFRIVKERDDAEQKLKEKPTWSTAYQVELNAYKQRIQQLTDEKFILEKTSRERIAELEKERDEALKRYDQTTGTLQARIADLTKPREVALPPGGVVRPLTDEECNRLANEYLTASEKYLWTQPCTENELRAAYRCGVRALLAAAGRYAAPVESKGPATTQELNKVFDERYQLGAMTDGLRAVYDLGVKHGSGTLECGTSLAQGYKEMEATLRETAAHAEKAEKELAAVKEMYQNAVNDQMRMVAASHGKYIPFTPDDALVEKMARAISDDFRHDSSFQELARAALSALPPLFVAATTEETQYAMPLPTKSADPERLPFRGLTKEEARKLLKLVELYDDDLGDALRIISRALGVTE